jgi:uncharacterized protein YciI
MNFWVLTYEVVENFVGRRAPYRGEHLRLVRDAYERGELLLAGAVGEPADEALLVFRCADRGAAERFAEADPYVTGGLVARWKVRPWAVVVGNDLEPPRPGRGQ